ncbi:sugar kinase [uncultured Ruegeria sp.]|uniref:sugar kinase n=1 Tax=uncultured Ruegeria sp. TaxID=259304 RepID=UPI00261A20CD|nr:sugar kinase [uncultured Ruegeria sp.]
MRFLAIGECMAELAPVDGVREFKLGFAGDTFNTAWYLAQVASDIDVGYLTAVGDDAISQDMRTFMKDSRICDTHVQVIAGKTVGLYLIHLNNGERSFSYWRDDSAARQLAVDEIALGRAVGDADLIYFSGITLAILDPQSREKLLNALRHARAYGITVAFDTNLRPRLWSSPKEMTDTIMEAAAQSDIVLPSYDDEAEWFGDRDSIATLNRYAEIGADQIVVKNSAQPVLFQNDGQRGAVDVDTVTSVVDTTAAGDSFNAGVLASVIRNDDLISGIRQGCRLAGRVVRHKGALIPIEINLRRDEVGW